jgi:hypothetical protein
MHSIARNTPLALAAALLLSPASALGDDKADRDAQARFAEGLARVKRGDFEAARISFAQAYVVLHKPDILWNLALAEEKSAHPLEALSHFKELTTIAEADTDRASAQKHVVGLMAQTGHIDVRAPAGTVVTIDGVQSGGRAPFADPLDVLPGRHVVEGRLSDGTKSVTLDTAAGETAQATFPSSDLGPPPSNGSAPTVSPPASSSTASAASPVSPPTEAPAADSTAPSGAKIATTVTLGAAGLIAIGLGAYFGLQSQSDASSAAGYRNTYGTDHCVNPANMDCSAWNSDVEAQNRDATASNVLYVAGGVLVAGAVASWLFWPKPHQTSSAWVMPMVGPTEARVGVGGTF